MPIISAGDVKKQLQDFGINPTDAEVASLGGLTSGYGGEQAIAQYALAKSQQMERQANDPLNAVLSAEKTFTSANEEAAKGNYDAANKLYDQLQGVMTQAPKLFGNLTPDQVDQYIAPLKQTFDEADATAQTGAAARGLAGSNIEANARSGEATKFKQQVLSTGLQVGLTEQQQQEQLMQQEIARRSGVGDTATKAATSGYQLQGATAGQLSSQARSDQVLLSSLPTYLRAQVEQELAARKAAEGSHGFLATLGQIQQGFSMVKGITSDAANIGSAGAADRFSLSPQAASGGTQAAAAGGANTGLLSGATTTSTTSSGVGAIAPAVLSA